MDPTMQLFTKESTLVSMRVLQSSNTTACDNNYGDNYFSPPSLMEKNWLVMRVNLLLAVGMDEKGFGLSI